MGSMSLIKCRAEGHPSPSQMYRKLTPASGVEPSGPSLLFLPTLSFEFPRFKGKREYGAIPFMTRLGGESSLTGLQCNAYPRV